MIQTAGRAGKARLNGRAPTAKLGRGDGEGEANRHGAG